MTSAKPHCYHTWSGILIFLIAALVISFAIVEYALRHSHWLPSRFTGSLLVIHLTAMFVLLFGSPFLLRSQRRLALVSWSVAALVFAYSTVGRFLLNT